MLRKLLLATVVAGAAMLALPASAAVVTLGGTDWTIGGTQLQLSNSYPTLTQPQSTPCIICGANQPQQNQTTFGYNSFGNTGNQSDLLYFSTATVGGVAVAPDTLGTGYTTLPGSPLLGILGNNLTFSVAIDVNDTGTAQTLESFYFLNLTTHTVLASYSPEPGGTLIPSQNNGTGTADYTLGTFTLAGVNPGDEVIFFARISGANDGPDSFFLVADPQAAVPEPSTWAMMILGFVGVAGYGWRKKKQAAAIAA